MSGTSHIATYTVVKLWEEDPGEILAMRSPGLCPFVPLMRGEPRKLFVESRKKIEGAPEAVPVLRVLERRFGEVPPDLRAEVEGISALPRLETLLDEAVTCASLAEFREVLQGR